MMSSNKVGISNNDHHNEYSHELIKVIEMMMIVMILIMMIMKMKMSLSKNNNEDDNVNNEEQL